MGHNIRRVEESDMDQLLQLCADHAVYEGSSYNPKDKVSHMIKHLIGENPAMLCYVVELKDQLIGYVTFGKQFSTWDADHYVYMDCLYLRSEARGMKIGQELMQIVTDYCISEKCLEVQWQTPNSNEGAIRFYKRLGAESKSKQRFFLNPSAN